MDCLSIRTLVRSRLEQLCPANLSDQCPATIFSPTISSAYCLPIRTISSCSCCPKWALPAPLLATLTLLAAVWRLSGRNQTPAPYFADCRRRQPLPQHARISALVYLLPYRIQPDSVADTFLSERCFRRPFIYPNQTMDRRYSCFIDFNRHGKPQLGISKSDPI